MLTKVGVPTSEAPPESAGPSRFWVWLVAAGLLLGCLPFAPGLWGPFQHDDLSNLPRLVVGPFSLEALVDVALKNESGPLRRPLSNAALALNYWLHGISDPFGFKLFNLLIHLTCGVAVYWLTREFIGRLPGTSPSFARNAALFSALTWTVHPIQVSTALYVVQRMAQLSALFTFVAVAWACRAYFGQGRPSPLSNLKLVAILGAGTLLAVSAKENGALTPSLAGIAIICLLGARGNSLAAILQGLRNNRTFVYLGLLLPALAAVAVVATQPDLIIGGYARRSFDLEQRLATQAVVMWKYVGLIVWPDISHMGLYHEVGTRNLSDPLALAATAAWLSVLLIALWCVPRKPLFAFPALWFLVSHLMESTVLPLEMIYEHRNYVGLAGFALFAGWGLESLRVRFPSMRRVGWAIPVLALAALTFNRALDWSTPERFYASELRHHPHSFRALLGVLAISKSAGASDEFVRVLEDEVVARRSHHLWTSLVPVSRQCTDSEHPVDWADIRQRIRESRSLGRLSRYAQLIVELVLNGKCPGLDHAEFRQTLELSYLHARVANQNGQAAAMASLLAWLSRSEGDLDTAASWHWRSARADPDGFEPLFALAYLELNRASPEAVEAVIEELRKRTRIHGLRVGYRTDEVEQHLAQLRRDMASAASERGQDGAEPAGEPAGLEPD